MPKTNKRSEKRYYCNTCSLIIDYQDIHLHNNVFNVESYWPYPRIYKKR